jgi:hypothetical protein
MLYDRQLVATQTNHRRWDEMHIPRSDMRIFPRRQKQTKQKTAQENQQQQTTERGQSPNKNNQQHCRQGTEKREILPMPLHFKEKTNSCALNLHKG